MIIKVCGITEQKNYDEICALGVEMIGINFYEPSSRYIGDRRLESSSDVLRTGVFVNASEDEIKAASDKHHLDYAQLHGDESTDFCAAVAELLPVIKVFRVDQHFDWQTVSQYRCADYHLFDTRTPAYGGSGKKFDWSVLSAYNGEVPFLLSGGIGPNDVDAILGLEHPQCVGVDINSGFETSPGVKDVMMITEFQKTIMSKI